MSAQKLERQLSARKKCLSESKSETAIISRCKDSVDQKKNPDDFEIGRTLTTNYYVICLRTLITNYYVICLRVQTVAAVAKNESGVESGRRSGGFD